MTKRQVRKKSPIIEDTDDSEEDESSDLSNVEPALKTISFRSNRGAGIQKLLDQKKIQEDIDDFWQENKYFGKVKSDQEQDSDDNEDYEQSQEDVKDDFDTDFNKSSDDEDAAASNDDENPLNKPFRGNFVQKEKIIKKNISIQEKPSKKNIQKEIVSRPKRKKYIHEMYSQEQLLIEAAYVELYNQQSLEELLRLEENKKIFSLNKKMFITAPSFKLFDSIKNNQPKKYISFSDKNAQNHVFQDLFNKQQKNTQENNFQEMKQNVEPIDGQTSIGTLDSSQIDNINKSFEQNIPHDQFQIIQQQLKLCSEGQQLNFDQIMSKLDFQTTHPINKNIQIQKYKDPISKQKYNTINEYQQLQQKSKHEKLNKIKSYLRIEKDLLKFKQQQLEQLQKPSSSDLIIKLNLSEIQ